MSTLVLATAGPATADTVPAPTAHDFTVCATGNYNAYFEIQGQNDKSLEVVQGTCVTKPAPPGTEDTVTVEGMYNTHPDVSFTVGSTKFEYSTGGAANAAGTTTAPVLEVGLTPRTPPSAG